MAVGGSITMFPNLSRARRQAPIPDGDFLGYSAPPAAQRTRAAAAAELPGRSGRPRFWRRRFRFDEMTAAMAAATSELGGRLRNRAIAKPRPWPSDVLALGFRAPADWPIATH